MTEFINTPPLFEAKILNLSTEILPELVNRHGLTNDMYLLEGQVSARMLGPSRISIQTRDVQVVAFNPAVQQMHYNVVRVKNYEQNWDAGGSYLDPKRLESEPLY